MSHALTARSVVLSVLLGAHPAWATAAELLRLTADFGIREPTLRVALTRMVSAGDLVRSNDGYRLSDRLLARQHRQDEALNPVSRNWDGTWITVIITAVGADARTRGVMRTTLQDNRFGELREGVWMRPDNLEPTVPVVIRGRARVLRATDDNSAELALRLWDIRDWSKAAHRLLRQMNAANDIPSQFVVAAAIVRHLLTDPVLPAELLPADWPAESLRAAYYEFAELLTSRREDELLEAR